MSVIEDAEATLRIEITYETFLKPSDSDWAIVPASELESGILAVQVLIQSNPLTAVTLINGDLGREIRVAEERYELAFGLLVSASFISMGDELTCPSLS